MNDMLIAFLIGIVVALIGIRWLLITDPAVLIKVFKVSAVVIFAIAIAFLFFSGRLNIFMLAAFIPMIIPYFFRMKFGDKDERNKYESSFSGKSKISVKEAYDILGLEPNASKKEIIEAHRKLMLKVHPDQGGSNYLAKQLNEAKDVLLGKK